MRLEIRASSKKAIKQLEEDNNRKVKLKEQIQRRVTGMKIEWVRPSLFIQARFLGLIAKDKLLEMYEQEMRPLQYKKDYEVFFHE